MIKSDKTGDEVIQEYFIKDVANIIIDYLSTECDICKQPGATNSKDMYKTYYTYTYKSDINTPIHVHKDCFTYYKITQGDIVKYKYYVPEEYPKESIFKKLKYIRRKARKKEYKILRSRFINKRLVKCGLEAASAVVAVTFATITFPFSICMIYYYLD